MTRRFGFTLAEVLITLGIIGVVAALTMPTLINSTRGMQNRVAFKKALSVISQAVTLNLALDDYDFNVAAGTDATPTTDVSIYNIFRNRMSVVKAAESGMGYDVTLRGATLAAAATATGTATPGDTFSGDDTYRSFFMSDGMVFTYLKADATCQLNGVDDLNPATGEDGEEPETNYCVGLIDVNGQKGPNTQTVCDEGSEDTCVVESPSDVYPVYFGGTVVLPATDAGKTVLYGR